MKGVILSLNINSSSPNSLAKFESSAEQNLVEFLSLAVTKNS